MKETDKAYLAGFLDGEGTIGIYKHYIRGRWATWESQVSICNAERTILEYLKLLLWGEGIYCNIYESKNRRYNQRNVFLLTIYSKQATRFLKLLMPYLKLKRPQAELMLKFRELVEANVHRKKLTQEQRQQRDSIMEELRLHNRRGVW